MILKKERKKALRLFFVQCFQWRIIIAIMFVLPLICRQLGQNFDPFVWLVIGPVNYVAQIIAIAAGIR